MAIKVHKSKKYHSKKQHSKKTKKQHHSKKQHKSRSKSKSKSKSKSQNKNNVRHNNKRKMQRGGFADCNLASIKEPGINVPALGNIAGLSIPESRGAIYRPNCKQDTYQAMTP